eukprot:s504_g4.t1
MALKAAVVPQVDEAMQVESLRLEARNAMLKAAGNGRLAQALKQMRKALPEAKLAVPAAEEPQADAKEVSVSEVFNTKAAIPKGPGQEDFSQSTARALKLAWCMAGSPARSLRQKEARKALQSERFCRPSLQAYPFVEHVQAEDKRDSEPIGAPCRSADHLAGQPRLMGSASAISLGLSRAKVGLRRVNSRCSSVGSLRPLKVKGPVLPPALPPTAFLQKHEPAAKQGMPCAPSLLPRARIGRVARRGNEFSSAEIVLAASAGIVTWVATGGNPGNLLGLGGGRSLKRQDMAEKEVQVARQMFFRAAENYADSRESTGVLLNRMAPEIVQVAKQRLEGAIKTLQQSWREQEIAQGEQEVKAYLVPEYLRNGKEQGAFMIAVAGNQSVGKSSFLRAFLGYEKVTAPTTTTEPVPYLFPVESDVPCMLWDLPPMPLGAARDQYMAMVGLRHFDLVIVMMDNKFSETELLLLDELKNWKVPHVLVRNKLDVDIEREFRNEQLVWDFRGVKDGLDDGVRAEILTDTLTTVKEDLVDLCAVKSVYCISTKGEYQQLFDWPALDDDLRKTIHMRCIPSVRGDMPGPVEEQEATHAELKALTPRTNEADQNHAEPSSADYEGGWRTSTVWQPLASPASEKKQDTSSEKELQKSVTERTSKPADELQKSAAEKVAERPVEPADELEKSGAEKPKHADAEIQKPVAERTSKPADELQKSAAEKVAERPVEPADELEKSGAEKPKHADAELQKPVAEETPKLSDELQKSVAEMPAQLADEVLRQYVDEKVAERSPKPQDEPAKPGLPKSAAERTPKPAVGELKKPIAVKPPKHADALQNPVAEKVAEKVAKPPEDLLKSVAERPPKPAVAELKKPVAGKPPKPAQELQKSAAKKPQALPRQRPKSVGSEMPTRAEKLPESGTERRQIRAGERRQTPAAGRPRRKSANPRRPRAAEPRR